MIAGKGEKMADVKPREHVVFGEDLQKGGQRPSGLDGKTYLEGILRGTIAQAPAAKLIGYSLVAVEKGRVVFALDPSEAHLNPFGTVHGGIVSTILDSAMTASVLSAVEPGFGCATIEVKVNFVRPLNMFSGTVKSEGQIVHLGKRIAVAQARVYDSNRNLCALSTGTVSVFKSG